jgi:hypothetical protein
MSAVAPNSIAAASARHDGKGISLLTVVEYGYRIGGGIFSHTARIFEIWLDAAPIFWLAAVWTVSSL